MEWCGEQLIQNIKSTCSDLDTEGAVLTCGTDIASEYRSSLFRHGPAKCTALEAGSEGLRECLIISSKDIDKAFLGVFEGWEKVRAGGDADSQVVSALKDTITCLEGLGYENVDTEILFDWQRFDSPQDGKERENLLTQEQKDLRAELRMPSDSCAKRNGLYAAQDVAWAAELEKLHENEPDTVQILIDEGLLEALRLRGIEAILKGERL